MKLLLTIEVDVPEEILARHQRGYPDFAVAALAKTLFDEAVAAWDSEGLADGGTWLVSSEVVEEETIKKMWTKMPRTTPPYFAPYSREERYVKGKRQIILTHRVLDGGGHFTATCDELGLATFGTDADDVDRRLAEAVTNVLNTVEGRGEIDSYLEEHNVLMPAWISQ